MSNRNSFIFIKKHMEHEVFADIEGYEGYYQISNWGRIKTLSRIVRSGKGTRVIPEGIRSPNLNQSGYLQCTLSRAGKTRSHYIHHLVWAAFGDEELRSPTSHIDHINNDKLNNAIWNLRVIPARENVAKMWKQYTTSSRHTGVHRLRDEPKWHAYIKVAGKKRHLGTFLSEEDAAQAYRDAKATINRLAA